MYARQGLHGKTGSFVVTLVVVVVVEVVRRKPETINRKATVYRNPVL